MKGAGVKRRLVAVLSMALIAAACTESTPATQHATGTATGPAQPGGRATTAPTPVTSPPVNGAPIDLVANPFRTGKTLVIPHGGGDGLFPENTLVAYTKTVAMGADVIDVDLRITGDGVVVAFHDSTLDRVTGQAGKVLDHTYAELSALDAGWGFADADGSHPFRGTGVQIPTLAAILDQFPATLLSFDLKDETTAMVQPVCDALVSRGRLNDVFVGSNSDAQIFQVRETCPTVRTSATMIDVYASRDAKAADRKDFVPAVVVDQPPYRIDGRTIVDADSLAWAHDYGVAILPWLVNDESDMRRLVELGVDGIYTSYPDRLLKLLGRYVDPA